MLWTAIVNRLRSSRHPNITLCSRRTPSNARFLIHKLSIFSFSDKLLIHSLLCIFLMILALRGPEVPETKHLLKIVFIHLLYGYFCLWLSTDRLCCRFFKRTACLIFGSFFSLLRSASRFSMFLRMLSVTRPRP